MSLSKIVSFNVSGDEEMVPTFSHATKNRISRVTFKGDSLFESDLISRGSQPTTMLDFPLITPWHWKSPAKARDSPYMIRSLVASRIVREFPLALPPGWWG